MTWLVNDDADGLGLLYCELQILSHLVQEDDGEVSMDLMESSGGHSTAHLVG